MPDVWRSHTRRRAGWTGALAVVLLAEGCAPGAAFLPAPRPGEAPFGRVIAIRVDSSRILSRGVSGQPSTARRRVRRPVASPRPSAARRDKIHPMLARWLADSLAANPRVQVLVTLRDTMRVPRFPDPDPGASPFPVAPAGTTARKDSTIASIQSVRVRENARLERTLATRHGATVLERFWITRALLTELPLREVPALARLGDVVYMAPRFSGEKPPVCGDPDCNPRCDYPWQAIRQMNAARFRDVTSDGLDYGWFTLLDTGVRAHHEAFRELSATGVPWTPHVGFLDCHASPDCQGSAPAVDRDANGHGTSSAAILVGFQNRDETFCQRGSTRMHVVSINVYGDPGACSDPDPALDRAAVLRAFELGQSPGRGHTYVCETQAFGDDITDISAAAAGAFDAGAVVIAANGNCGAGCVPDLTLPCPQDCLAKGPANSPWVIGVGAYQIQDPDRKASSGHCAGTPEGRLKPDILAPTSSYVASNTADDGYHAFTGTSGATPYAAAAAAMLRNFILVREEQNWRVEDRPSEIIDPGHVYAGLLLCGPDMWSATGSGFDPRRGVGPLTLPDLSFSSWFGKASVSSTLGEDVTFDLTGLGVSRLDAALWWPDPRVAGAYQHSLVELRIDGPGGAHAESLDPKSVFQRTGCAAADGMWTMRIDPASLPAGVAEQTVYYAVIAR